MECLGSDMENWELFLCDPAVLERKERK